ncbi:hypothetical protein Ac2012v2_003210 [Leucoagaricus gongylophorus]
MTPVLDSPLPTTPPLQNQSYAKSNTTATKYIQLGDTFTPISDPWRDDIPLYDQPQRRELQTPDPSIFDQTITASILDNSQVTGTRLEPVSKDVLSEFDPLVASAEEQAAHDAWETAESHPPPRSSSLSPYSAPVKDGQNPSPGSRTRTLESGTCSSTPLPVSPTPSSFPSLAVLARTFSIPSFSPKTRSLSLDVAKPIASPSTLSFVGQQDQRAEVLEDERSPVLSTANSLARSDVSTVRDSRDGGGNGSKSAEGQFDFQKFLDQMKTRSADPVSKYLRSFLSNFTKRTFAISDQIKIINDFLTFISGQMRSCDTWKNSSDADFDNAMEGMEKLVMNRLYDFTFTPQVIRAHSSRPITTDDLERDRVLSQRIALFGWLEEKHLDIHTGDGSKGFMMFAQQGDAKRLLQKTGDTISKPLNALGRIFTEALDGTENKFISLPGSPAPLEPGQEQRENMVGPDTQYSRQHPSGVGPLTNIGHEDMLPIQTPYKPRVRRGPSPSSQSVGMPSGSLPIYGGGYAGPEDTSSTPASGPYTNQSLVIGPSQPYSSHDPGFQSLSYSPSGQHLLPPRVQLLAGGGGGGSFGGEISRVPTPSLDFAGVQAEIDTAHEQAARAAKETLRQIFPAVDSDVVDWVLEAKEGDLGKSIEALLEISSGT